MDETQKNKYDWEQRLVEIYPVQDSGQEESRQARGGKRRGEYII